MDQRQRLRIPLPNALTGEVTVYRPLDGDRPVAARGTGRDTRTAAGELGARVSPEPRRADRGAQGPRLPRQRPRPRRPSRGLHVWHRVPRRPAAGAHGHRALPRTRRRRRLSPPSTGRFTESGSDIGLGLRESGRNSARPSKPAGDGGACRTGHASRFTRTRSASNSGGRRDDAARNRRRWCFKVIAKAEGRLTKADRWRLPDEVRRLLHLDLDRRARRVDVGRHEALVAAWADRRHAEHVIVD